MTATIVRLNPPVTPQSIHAAKAACEAERVRIFLATGLVISDTGTIQHGATS
jgi:hypothetical protein